MVEAVAVEEVDLCEISLPMVTVVDPVGITETLTPHPHPLHTCVNAWTAM